MTIKALVLDLDGTLYITREVNVIDKVCRARAHEYLERKKLISKIPAGLMHKIDREMGKGYVSSNVRKLSKMLRINYYSFNRYVNVNNPSDFGINKDKKLISLLTKASKKYKIFVFTNAPIIWARRAVRDIGLRKFVSQSHIICPERMGKFMKPDIQAYKIMLRITGMKSGEVLFLDDRKDNVNTAKKLGIASIHVYNGRNKRNSIYSILGQVLKDTK